jgi:excisionase family DNA binding protein
VNNEFLLSEDVAKLLGISRSTVQEQLSRCLIPHRKMPFTRRCLIPRRDFDAWMDGAELETHLLAGGGRVVTPKKVRRVA